MDGRAAIGLACAIAAACWLLACAAIVVARLAARRSRRTPTLVEPALALATGSTSDPRAAVSAGPESRELLERGLRSTEPEVRRAAVSALGRLGRSHEWAIDGLVEALAERRDVPARVAAELDRLAPRADTRLAPLLGHPNSVVRYYAARLLARDGDAGGLRTRDLTADPSPHVRAAALERLRAAGTGAALRLALRLLDDPHEVVRAEACRTASEISARAAAPFVAPLLGDPSWDVRDAARLALVSADVHALEVVVPLLDHHDRTIASLAALVLRDIGYVDELERRGDDGGALERLHAAGGRRFRALVRGADASSPAEATG